MTTLAAAERPAEPRFGHVQSVWRALDLLEALAGEEPAGLVELSARAGLQPSTARRLLATMAARGYVLQSRRSGGYLLGHRAAELRGPIERRHGRLRRIARPHLERARRVCGETTSLVVPVDGTAVLWLDEALGAPPVAPCAGRCLPAGATAHGKALQAAMGTADLRPELARIRDRGFAVQEDDLASGRSAVAAAAMVDGAPIAAIGVSGPSDRLRRVGFAELGEMASIFAEELGAELSRDAARPAAA
jgi:IclR family transcriptional regulator, acetate operon repressor